MNQPTDPNKFKVATKLLFEAAEGLYFTVNVDGEFDHKAAKEKLNIVEEAFYQCRLEWKYLEREDGRSRSN